MSLENEHWYIGIDKVCRVSLFYEYDYTYNSDMKVHEIDFMSIDSSMHVDSDDKEDYDNVIQLMKSSTLVEVPHVIYATIRGSSIVDRDWTRGYCSD